MSDLDDLFEIFSDPLAMKYYPSTKTRLQTEEWIQKNLDRYKTHGYGLWALIDKANNEFIGECGLTVQSIDGQDEDEIGYHVKSRYWNLGFASEAARATALYGFTVLRRNRLVCWMVPANSASRRVAEKTGMILKKKTVDSKGVPVVVYETTKKQWMEDGGCRK